MVLGAIFSYPIGVSAENKLSSKKFSQMFVSSSWELRQVKEVPRKEWMQHSSRSSSIAEVSPGTRWLRARQPLSRFILSMLKHCFFSLLSPQQRTTARTSGRQKGRWSSQDDVGPISYLWHHESVKETNSICSQPLLSLTNFKSSLAEYPSLSLEAVSTKRKIF